MEKYLFTIVVYENDIQLVNPAYGLETRDYDINVSVEKRSYAKKITKKDWKDSFRILVDILTFNWI